MLGTNPHPRALGTGLVADQGYIIAAAGMGQFKYTIYLHNILYRAVN